LIGLTKKPVPQVLVDHATEWNSEYVEWNRTKAGKEPRRYAHDDIRSGLRQETAGKCAYCEGFIGDVSYDHVEHMRPKKKNPVLVCEWSNLTLACQRCNTEKGDFEDDVCPLLDPYRDAPEQHISFGGPLALPKGGPRARRTITKLDLNRAELLFSRAQTLQRINDLLDLIDRTTDEHAVGIALWEDVDRLVSDSSEFSSACRYFVSAQIQERGLVRPRSELAV
jgi:uncharacterized protein (TIGR02646 family)